MDDVRDVMNRDDDFILDLELNSFDGLNSLILGMAREWP